MPWTVFTATPSDKDEQIDEKKGRAESASFLSMAQRVAEPSGQSAEHQMEVHGLEYVEL